MIRLLSSRFGGVTLRTVTLTAMFAFATAAAFAQVTYCSASVSYASSQFSYIYSVGMAGTGASSGPSSFVEGHTNVVFPLHATVSTPISVGVANPQSSDQVTVYCDWNGNGSFADAGEAITLAQLTVPWPPYYIAGAYTGAITMPSVAVAQTRMRVVLRNTNDVAGPCGPRGFGNIEDYTIMRLAPPPPPFQLNQASATFAVNGVSGNGSHAASIALTSSSACAYAICTATFSSTAVGQPWDLGVTGALAVPSTGPGFATAGQQRVNLDLSDPAFGYLNGGGYTNAFPGASSMPIGPGAPFQAAAQLLVLDPTLQDGVALSQPTNLTVTVAVPSPTSLPNTNDGATVVNLPAAGVASCPPFSAFAFFGTSYTQVTVSANGRLKFGSSGPLGGDFVPDVNGTVLGDFTSAVAGRPMIGAWCNFDSTLTVSQPPVISIATPSPGVVRVAYTGDPYFGQVFGPFATFAIVLDSNTGQASISGIQSFGLFTAAAASQNMFLGISAGGAGFAVDAGPTFFTPGLHAAPLTPGAMIYEFGRAGTLAGAGSALAIDQIVFTPSGTNYTALAF